MEDFVIGKFSQEYRRQTAEEKSSFLETMIAVHLRNGLPLPLVRIEHSACMTKLFRSLYQVGLFDCKLRLPKFLFRLQFGQFLSALMEN